jgi:amino acid adenylation domain-containing protein
VAVSVDTASRADRCPDSLHEAFAAQARATPDRIAVCAAERHISYRDLDDRSSRLAIALRRSGARLETCVGLCVERGIEMIVGMLAILKSGAAYVPLDPEYPLQRLRYIVDDGPMAAIVCSPHTDAVVASIGVRILSIQTSAADDARADAALPCVSRRNLAYVIYTSGSTGAPKGVLVEHGSVLHLLEQTLHRFGCDERDVWTQFHSISFDFSVWEIWGALLTGARLAIVSGRTARAPAACRAFVDQQQVTVLNQTPSAFRRFSQAYVTRDRRTTPLRLIVFGGEMLPYRLLDHWVSCLGDERPMLVNMYGITETTVHVTRRRILRHDLQERQSLIGVPIDGLEVQLLDANQQSVPTGTPGRLHVAGAGVARGYRNRPGLTAERFTPHVSSPAGTARLYDSGDLAVRLETGELAYLGRSDDQIKISGYRIEPREIEQCLLGHPAVAAAVVMAEELGPDATGLVAYVVPHGRSPEDADEREGLVTALATCARSHLPIFMRPSEYRFVPAFSLTAHGKIDRDALRAGAIPSPKPLSRPVISCLMVTRQRLAMATRAIDCFAAQDYEPRHLVIVSDGHEEYEALRQYAHAACGSAVTITSVPRGSKPLGELRNLALDLAPGDIVCQWDDDDLSHPRRLSMQLERMRHDGADACFLTEHLHLMADARSLYWCDWTRPRGMPLQTTTVPATVMCEKRAAGRYPEAGPVSRRSEDAVFMRSLAKRSPVATLSGCGWLYVYVFHGANTWDESHHQRIVRAIGLEAGELRQRRTELRDALAAYALGFDLTVRDYLGAEAFVLPAGQRD